MEIAFGIIDFVLQPNTIFFTVIGLLFITSLISLYFANTIQKNVDIKNEFITIISHKFRTPLTSVRWNIEDLISHEDNPEKKQMYEDMRASNQILIGLTNTLIDLTRTSKETEELSRVESVSIYDFVQGIVTPMRRAFDEKHIELSIACTDENKKVLVRVDKTRLEFVIIAVIKNALTYTPENGKVEIDILRDGKQIEVAVADNGIGIEKDQLESIFTEFHRAPNAVSFNTEGLGVDLYLVKSVIGRLNGTVRVFSEGTGKGSKFTLSLPKA